MEWNGKHGGVWLTPFGRAKNAGADAVLYTASGFSLEDFNHADAVAFGCPSMGAEELEESEFQPMFSSVEGELRDKKSLCSGPTAGATVNG